MKFMQRAAAAQSPASPSTPASDPDDSRPHKRAKLGNGLNKAEEASFVIDQKAAQAALQDEDRQRQAAMDKMAERMGDAHWVLDTARLPSSHQQAGTPLKIVQVGFSEIDKRGESEEAQDEATRAFQSYGPKKEKAQKGKREKAGRTPPGQTSGGADVHLKASKDSDSDSDSDSSTSDSESDSDSDNSDSGSSSEEPDNVPQSKPGRATYGSQKRVELSRKRRAEQAKSKKMASDRKKKEINLHRLTSISGGGIAPKRPGPRR